MTRFIMKISQSDSEQYIFNKRTLVFNADMAKRFLTTKSARKYYKDSQFLGFEASVVDFDG